MDETTKKTGIVELAQMNETQARELLERIRWNGNPTCPHCGVVGESTKLNGKAHRAGLYQCNACREQYTVTTKTIMHRSKLPLVKWLLAFHLLCSSKKGISALQLQRQLNIGSYKTAWTICHKIRYAMTEDGGILGANGGVVEADETYVGGKPRRGERRPKGYYPQGAATSKVPVVAIVERDGRVVSKPMFKTKGGLISDFVREHTDRSGTLMTDESSAYMAVGSEFAGGHHRVKHSLDEFSRVDRAKGGGTIVAHNNTAESFFSLLKRQHVGAHHKWSKQHIHRYCNELNFRWNHRKETDFERTVLAIQMSEGKRMTYDALPTGSTFQ